MKPSHMAILFVVIVGIAVTTNGSPPLRGVSERRLGTMDEDDFKTLQVKYKAKSDPDDSICKITFEVDDNDSDTDERTIDVDGLIEESETAGGSPTVVCRRKIGPKEGVVLPVSAEVDTNDAEWIRKDGGRYDIKRAKVTWKKDDGDDDLKLKITIIAEKDDDNDPADPPDDDPKPCGVKYSYHGNCEALEGKEYSFDRDDDDVQDHDVQVDCEDASVDNDKVATYVVGLAKKAQCSKDKISECKVTNAGTKVRCLVEIAPKSADCDKDNVDVRIHALCC